MTKKRKPPSPAMTLASTLNECDRLKNDNSILSEQIRMMDRHNRELKALHESNTKELRRVTDHRNSLADRLADVERQTLCSMLPYGHPSRTAPPRPEMVDPWSRDQIKWIMARLSLLESARG